MPEKTGEYLHPINRFVLFGLSVLWMGLCAWQRWSIRRYGHFVESNRGSEPFPNIADKCVTEKGATEKEEGIA